LLLQIKLAQELDLPLYVGTLFSIIKINDIEIATKQSVFP